MTEKAIQNALWTWLREKGHEWMCPNFTPPRWWECDMFSTTKSGYVVEHEIKLTRSDFAADAKKERTQFLGRGLGWSKQKKHDALAAAKPHGPSRFFYVVPENLITLDMLPAFAGLIEVWKDKMGQVRFVELRPAPKLHGEKVCPKLIASLGATFYWRYWYQRGKRDPGGPIEYHI